MYRVIAFACRSRWNRRQMTQRMPACWRETFFVSHPMRNDHVLGRIEMYLERGHQSAGTGPDATSGAFIVNGTGAGASRLSQAV